MANEWKVSLLFNSNQFGWSETYYTTALDVEGAYLQATAIAGVRCIMCAPPTQLKFIRVSAEGFLRKSSIRAVGPGTDTPTPSSFWNANADLEGTAGVGTLRSRTAVVQRTTYLRGLSDNCYDRLDPDNLDAAKWRAMFKNEFTNLLTNTQWFIKTRGGPLIVKAKSVITAWVNQDNTAYSNMTLSQAIAGVVNGSMIILSDIANLKPAPGMMKVIGMANGGLNLVVEYSLPEWYTYQPGGQAYLYAPTYAPITDVNFVKFGHHNTGRPFGGSRGRRAAVRR